MKRAWTVLAVGVLLLGAAAGRGQEVDQEGQQVFTVPAAGAEAAPAAPSHATVHGGCCAGPAGCCGVHTCASHWHKLIDWLTYCPTRTPCHHGCGGGCGKCAPACDPPLYLFFLDNCTLPRRPDPVLPPPAPCADGACAHKR